MAYPRAHHPVFLASSLFFVLSLGKYVTKEVDGHTGSVKAAEWVGQGMEQ